MKAIELIKTLFDGWLDLEQGGVFVMDPETDEQFVMRYFRASRIMFGNLEVGNYVYFYEYEGLKLEDGPDVVIQTMDEQKVFLWKVEG